LHLDPRDITVAGVAKFGYVAGIFGVGHV
jgi:hypothetical protein